MPAVSLFRSVLSRARRAFSLIELAVVLIVIGIIAAIAIPTFQAVIERSEIRAAVAAQQAVARDVAAILAFQDGTSPDEALGEALAETASAAPVGVLAAAPVKVVLSEEPSTADEPNLTTLAADGKVTVSWALNDDYLGWATIINSDRGVKCRIKLATGGGECWASTSPPSGFVALAGPDSDTGASVVTIPTTTTPTLNAPATPAGVSVAASDTSVVISWDAVAGTSSAPVTGYRVFKDGAFLDVTSSTSLVAATLTNGTSYSFEVAAYGPGGISARSAAVTATPVAPPAQVTGVVATPGAGLVSLSWTAVETSAAAPVTGYRVFRGATQVLETPALGAIVTGLDDATSYSFTVRAYGPGGAGAASDAAVVSTFGGPAQVTGVTGTPGAKLVVLSWTEVAATPTAPVTGYRVFRGGTQILETPSTGAIVTGLDDDTSYSFTVVAYGPGGVGAASDQVSVTTFGAPAKVTGVSATPTGTFITVSWSAVAANPTAPVTGYRVLKNGVQIADTPGTSTLVTGLAAGTSYSFTVVAYGPGGVAVASNPASATTLAPPAKVTGVAADPIGTSIVSLTWNVVTSTAGAPVTGYRVYQNGNQVAETPSTSTLVTGLSSGTNYIFTVAAYGPAGEGAESSSVSATTPVPTTTTTTTTTTAPPPLLLSYASGAFANSASATITPSTSGALGGTTFSVTAGSVPSGVTFNTTTGVFTGPASWPVNLTAISTGFSHACGIDTAGAAWCWGTGTNGRLGNGDTTSSSTPVRVTGLTSGVTAIAAGDTSSCAVQSGSAKCWGNAASGQLGNGGTTASSVPVQVTGLTSGVTAISVGQAHACAVHSGAAKCWGNPNGGRLGNSPGNLNDTTPQSVPVQVTGLTSDVTAISAGPTNGCAVQSGSAKCWGGNGAGQLGNGTSGASAGAPVQVTGLTSGVTAISAGGALTCAVHSGAAKCWGSNFLGALGNGSGTNSTVPVQVTGLTSGVTSITANTDTNYYFACAVQSGSAKCWGSGSSGKLGNAGTADSSVPVQVSGLTSGMGTVMASGTRACAVQTSTGAAHCWGSGSGTSPVRVPGFGPAIGFPAPLTVQVSDGVRTTSTTVTLTAP